MGIVALALCHRVAGYRIGLDNSVTMRAQQIFPMVP